MERQTEYVTDAVEMLGKGYDHPAVEIEAPRQVIERRNGRMQEIERAAFVKISTAFKPEMRDIDEIALKIWLYIALSVNRHSGKAHPGLRTIAQECNFAVNTVRAALERLENKYALLVVHRGEKKYNIYEPVEFVSARRETVSADDTDGETVSDERETVSAKTQTVSPRMILNQINQSEPDDKRESTKSIISALQNNGIHATYGVAERITDWTAEHDDAWILKAIEKGRGKNLNYIDRILLDWKANGYPKSRAEQIAGAKRTPQPAANERVPAGV